MNKPEKTLKSQILALLGVKAGGDLPEDFPKEEPEVVDAPVDAPADLSALAAKLDECMNRISAIEAKLAGTEVEMDKCKEAAAEASEGVLQLAQAFAKASKGAIKATVIPTTDKVRTNVGKAVLDNESFIESLTDKYKLVK